MSKSIVTLSDLSYTYPGAATPVLNQVNGNFTAGFTGVLGANGAGKSTLLQIIAGTLAPDSGTVIGNDFVVFCEQRTDHPPADLADFMSDDSGAAWEVRSRLDIPYDAEDRWETLSHGERKRTQIATALWRSPDVLLIDEPSNHIDGTTRQLLEEALARFTGIGILVSHDRGLLDALCHECLWIDRGKTQRFPGGYSTANALRQQAFETGNQQYEKTKSEFRKLEAETHRRREKAARADSDRSKKKIDPKDKDAKTKVDLARLTGKDAVAGKLLNQMAGRVEQAQEKLDQASFNKSYLGEIWLSGKPAPREHLWVGEPRELPIATGRALFMPSMDIRRTDRIVLTGDNGLGKSTLVRCILNELSMDSTRLIYLPQELTAEEGQAVLADARSLDKSMLGRAMQIVSRLGSDPGRLLDSSTPSPGELRKLLLALGLVREPWLIVMDEPTNHLDLPSIELLSAALTACPCALLMVTHDEQLSVAVATREWRLTADGENTRLAERYLSDITG